MPQPVVTASALSPQSFFWLLIVLALFACTLPWLVNPGAALSLNVYDLAEWTSLVPSVRGGSPPLLTTLLLRLPLTCLAWIIAFRPGSRALRALLVVLAAVALLPPFQFLATPDDINYRQQFVLSATTFIIGVMGVSDRLRRWRRSVAVAVSIAGALAVFVGVLQAYAIMREYQLPTQVGLGGVLFVACVLGLTVLFLKQTRWPTPVNHPA